MFGVGKCAPLPQMQAARDCRGPNGCKLSRARSCVPVDSAQNGGMKATVLTAVKAALMMQELSDLAAAPGRAVVRLKAAALNHRDLWTQLGLYPNSKRPVTLGSDGAGVVTAAGTESDRSWVGREVIINPSLDWGPDPRAQGKDFRILGLPDNGTFAEQVSIPVANLAPKPAHLTWEQAAALPLTGLTAWRALFTRAQLKAGERVLVTGIGGGAALIAMQFAAAAGAAVWGTSSSPEKLARAETLGAAGGVNYRDADWAAALQKQAGGPFDVILHSPRGPPLSRPTALHHPPPPHSFFLSPL